MLDGEMFMTDLQSSIVLWLKLIFELLCYSLFISLLLDGKFTKKTWRYCVVGILNLVFLYEMFTSTGIKYWSSLNLVISGLTIILLYRVNIKKIVMYLVFPIAFVALVFQAVSLFFTEQMLDYRTSEFFFFNGSSFIVIFAIIFLLRFIKMWQRNRTSFSEIPLFLYVNFVLGALFTLFPTFIVISVGHLIKDKTELAMMIISYTSLILCFFTSYLFIKHDKERMQFLIESEEKGRLIEVQKLYYEEILHNYEAIRSFKHDVKAHVRVLHDLTSNNKFNELQVYIQNLSGYVKDTQEYQCSNLYINAIMNSFASKIAEEKIAFQFEYTVKGSICMDNVDICSLFHNLISNAIEGCLRDERQERMILLRIDNVDGSLYINITNNVVDGLTLKDLKGGNSSKKDGEHHGIGMRNITRIVKKYAGHCEKEIKNGSLTIEILIRV